MTRTFFFLFFVLPFFSNGQDTSLVFGKDLAASITTTVDNEWGTTDTLNYLYTTLKANAQPALEYYPYQDRGGDCNNLFWMKESVTIEDGEIVLLSHYFQKTGIDPIPEWRKRIYTVDAFGDVTLIYDQYKYYHTSEWVDE